MVLYRHAKGPYRNELAAPLVELRAPAAAPAPLWLGRCRRDRPQVRDVPAGHPAGGRKQHRPRAISQGTRYHTRRGRCRRPGRRQGTQPHRHQIREPAGHRPGCGRTPRRDPYRPIRRRPAIGRHCRHARPDPGRSDCNPPVHFSLRRRVRPQPSASGGARRRPHRRQAEYLRSRPQSARGRHDLTREKCPSHRPELRRLFQFGPQQWVEVEKQRKSDGDLHLLARRQ